MNMWFTFICYKFNSLVLFQAEKALSYAAKMNKRTVDCIKREADSTQGTYITVQMVNVGLELKVPRKTIIRLD